MKAQELRESLLQAAVQGKLVPQNPNNEPASELFKRIQKEKENSLKEKKLKNEKPLPILKEEEKPFDLPQGWIWCKLGEISYLYTGNSINAVEKKLKYTNLETGYPYIATKDISFDSEIDYSNGIQIPYDTSYKIAYKGSVLLCIEGGSAGRKVGILEQDVCFGNKLCCFFINTIFSEFIYYFLQTPLFYDLFTQKKSGMIGGVGVNSIKELPVPLPPLSEQAKIITHLKNLLPLVGEFKKSEEQLLLLEKNFSKELKRSIIEFAIQGKLTHQRSDDEAVTKLLDKVKEEKDLLQTTRKSKIKTTIILDEMKPFSIPNSWNFVYLIDLLMDLPKNGYSPVGVPYETKFKVLTLSATTSGELDLSKFKYFISEKPLSPSLYLKDNDILIQRSNTLDYVGTACLCTESAKDYIYPDLMMKLCCSSHINPKYIYYVLSSDYIKQYFRKSATGTSGTMKKINQTTVSKCIIPLPPLEEQKRIVAKVDELMALCEGFKAL